MMRNSDVSLLKLCLISLKTTSGINQCRYSTSSSSDRSKLYRADGLTFKDFVSGSGLQINSSDLINQQNQNQASNRLPDFLKTEIPTSKSYNSIKRDLRGLGLHTVCEEARCPNIGQCWGGEKGEATATIMLMGDTCTRACRFCAIKTSNRPPPLDPNEPENTAEAIRKWGVGYIVMTSVDRDDLFDGGASHIAETIRRVKLKAPHILIEALTPDFAGPNQRSSASIVSNSGLDVFAHNLETVERLTPTVRDRRAKFRQSLDTLRWAKESGPDGLITKTSLMLGVGEEDHEVMHTLKELRKNSVDVVTFGQYMRPTKRHMKVDSYIEPKKFEYWKNIAEGMGFIYVASGPLVRSSFKANELLKSSLGKRLLEKTSSTTGLK
ncbi:lipoyl synthase [Phakopsora pachyrhizi]|nr:lipoyl synthase [Phakopsora pachyrhizi]